MWRTRQSGRGNHTCRQVNCGKAGPDRLLVVVFAAAAGRFLLLLAARAHAELLAKRLGFFLVRLRLLLQLFGAHLQVVEPATAFLVVAALGGSGTLATAFLLFGHGISD